MIGLLRGESDHANCVVQSVVPTDCGTFLGAPRNLLGTGRETDAGDDIMDTTAEIRLVTSEEFVTDLLCEMTLQNMTELHLADTLADKRFALAFDKLVARRRDFNIALDFSLATNPYHGDSSTLREALYSLRERGVVAINNPSFKTVEIKIDADDAVHYLGRSSIPRPFLTQLVTDLFGGQTGDEHGRQRNPARN